MIAIAKGLTKHTIVLVVDKRERAISMQAILTKMGYRIIVSLSLYDALRSVAQEMPHLVISEALLSDGSAGAMFDRLQKHPILKRTPILVNVLKKTKAELAALGQRKFAGFVLGKPEPKAFATKVAQVMAAGSKVSPHYIAVSKFHLKRDAKISVDADIVGRRGDFMVSKSHVQLDGKASMVCSPTDGGLRPAMVRTPTNYSNADGTFNLFPIDRIIGSGRKWIEKLPEVDPIAAKSPFQKTVIFYDPSEERFKQFERILGGYDIDVTHASTLRRTASLVQRDPSEVGCVYLHELLSDSSAIEWKKFYGQLKPVDRPTLVVGTECQNVRSADGLIYIRRPFGIGVFVESLKSAFETSQELAEGVESIGYSGVNVRFQAPAKLIGLDETGGILEVKFPVVPGCKLEIEHSFLDAVWAGSRGVKAVAVAAAPGMSHVWQVRFEASVASSTNKTKYWERICTALASLEQPPVGKSA